MTDRTPPRALMITLGILLALTPVLIMHAAGIFEPYTPPDIQWGIRVIPATPDN